MGNSMTKTDIINLIADQTSTTKKESERMLSAVISTIIESVSEGNKVAISGFGTFEVKDRAERMGINPKTKEPMKIQASRVPTFKAGKGFKDAVAK